MFRRSRFSIRPNVGTTGRTAATPQEAPSTNQEASETPKDPSEGGTPPDVTDTKSVVTPSEKPTASGDGNEQNAEGASSSAAVQRRKRFSVKPKVAPGRPSIAARTPKSPIKAVSEARVDVPDSDFDKTAKSDQTVTAAAPRGLQSPKRRRPSGESKQHKQPASSDSPRPSSAPVAEEPSEPTDPPTDSGKQLESSQIKEVPPKPPDKIHPSIPDKEAVEISEKAKTLVSTKTGLSLSPSALSLSRLLNDPSDLQRLAKAQKLRELLRQERHKEKKLKKSKIRIKEYTLDPAKMTMRDLIRYLPESNPMSSSLEETEENETIVPPSPAREESPERARGPEVVPTAATPRPGEEEEVEAEAEAEGEAEASEEDEDALMVPQVKVAEDGTLIIDEESLTVEVQRAKGPNPAQERDPIFERGSTTTYSSFRKGTYSKPWSSEETDMFFLAVSMVGTDFSMICQLFPHRARSEIKNKFKKEERENSWRIDKAFRERRKLDIEYFSKLLEKVLEVQQNKKKLKSLAVKNSPKKRSRKTKSKIKNEEDEEEEEEEGEDEEDQLPDLEDEKEGEKENEDLCNEGAAAASKMKRRRKRKTKQAAMDDEPKEKKKKRSEKSNKQGEASVPEDTEAALPDDNTSSDVSKKAENANASKDGAIKPAKLSRGRASKPLLPLGKKWSKKLPAASTKDKEADKGDETASEQIANKQVNEESSTSEQIDKRKSGHRDVSSEEEDAAVQPPRPTRYGRVPKPTNPLIYPAKEDPKTSASDATPASPQSSDASAAKPKPKSAAKRVRSSKQQLAQESKKPKLVTLRASQSEFSDDDDEKQTDREDVEEEEQTACSSSRDTVAPAFVPASLRSPHPVIPEVEETMEELDILANMPDVLGISQDALCPDASYDGAHNETAEPCEHQLDLLVDVIDFLSSEHTEVSEDESYNEAAQTLLTIGNLTHLSQSTIQDHLTDPTSVVVDEIRPNQEEETASEAALLTSGHEITETSTETIVEPQNSTTDNDNGDVPVCKSSDQIVFSDPLQSSSPQPKKGRSTKVKPKPNLGRTSRTARPANLLVTDSVSAPEPAQIPKIPERLSEELPLSQETTASQAPERTGVQFESSRDATSESSNEKPTPPFAESLKSDASGSETQVERGSNADPAPLQEPVDPKAESDVASACQSRKSRLQKIKPKPNLAQTSRTARSKPQTKQDSSEKDVEPEAEAACPTSSLSSLFESGSTLSVTEETITDVGPGGQECFGASTLDQTTSENFNLSADLFETPSTFESTVTSESSGNLVTPEKEESEAASTSKAKRARLPKVKPKPNLTQTPRPTRSKPQTTNDPVTHAQLTEKPCSSKSEPGSTDSPVAEAAEVETRPTCSVTLLVKPTQSAGAASVSVPPLEISAARKPTESTSTVEQKTDVGMNSSSDGSEPNAPQRRRRFSRVKPNLGSSTRTTHTKLQPENAGKPSEPSLNVTSQQHVDNSQPAGDGSPSRSTRSPLNTELGSTKSAPAESEKTLGGRSVAVTASGPVTSASLAADNQPASTDSVPENNSREKSTGESEARGGKVSDNDDEEAGASSPGGRQPDPAAESSEDGSTEWKINPTSAANAGSLLHPKESSPQPFSQSLSLGKEEEEGLKTSETNRTSNKKSQSAQSTDDAPSELSDSSKSSNKATQTRRGRLIKPKPNLGRSGRPSQAPQVQNAAQAEAALKETVSLAPSTSSVSAQQPAGGAVEPRGDQESTPNDPGSLLGRLTRASDGYTQTTSTPSREGTQNHPSLTMFPDMLPEQVQSDPDEPFFILSLTEIPVCPSGEVADVAAEPLPYLPARDASIQDQSVPGESLAAAGDGAVSDAPAESGETGLIGGPDTNPQQESLTENPVHPHEATAAQPPEPPQTEENNVETEVPRTRRGRRGAKAQAEPDAAGRKRAGETAADEAVGKPREGSDVRFSAEKETPAAQTNTRKTKGGNAGRRKPKDLPPPSRRDASGVDASRDSPPRPRPPGRSAARGSKVKTPAASTSPHSPTQNRPAPSAPLTAADVELNAEHGPDPRPSASQRAAEASPQMDCVDEEPTNVSQYFLSDIFTEVEEVE